MNEYQVYIDNLQSQVGGLDRELRLVWDSLDKNKSGDTQFHQQVQNLQVARDQLETATKELMRHADSWQDYKG